MNRRKFIRATGASALASVDASASRRPLTLFLGGDTMTGRGIDQILPNPGSPELHEPWVKDARRYVELAESRSGRIGRPVTFDYIWGDALPELDGVRPQVRIINLETSITISDRHHRHKAIHYRMHPDNAPVLTAAQIDCCVLANNHVLDWGRDGLRQTLETLATAGIQTAGAGTDHASAMRPAALPLPSGGRLLVFAVGAGSSGIPRGWAAAPSEPGVHFIEDLQSSRETQRIVADIAARKRPGDVVIASMHWGPNWGHRIPGEQIEFAHRLIDEAGVDVVHGHSSHHAKAIEVYGGRLILYGCGDLLNDYEGITGHERFRGDLALMYFPTLDPATGALRELRISPMQIRCFRLNRCGDEDARWLSRRLTRECRRFGSRLDWNGSQLVLSWGPSL